MTRSRYQAALEDVAEIIVGGKTRDEALLMLEEFLEDHGIVREWIGGPTTSTIGSARADAMRGVPDLTDPDVHMGTWPNG